MKYTVLVKESAMDGVIQAFLYYEMKLNGLGERFLLCWEKQIKSLESEPFHHQKKYKEFRQVLIEPYPYLIIYEVEQNHIVVYKVVYAGRHPRKHFLKK